MPDLIRYQPSKAHRDRLIASGFDPDDPNRRHPVMNLQAERLLTGRAQSLNRADLLKRGRGLISRFLQRGAVIALAVGFAPTQAYAGDDSGLNSSDAALILLMFLFLGVMGQISVLLDLIAALKSWKTASLHAMAALHRIEGRLGAAELTAAFEPALSPDDGDVAPKPGPQEDRSSMPPAVQNSPMRILLDCATRTGKIRKENQDAVGMDRIRRPDGEAAWMVVCDGVGGRPGGREAAHCAVEEIARHLETTDVLSATVCEAAIEDAREAFRRKRLMGMTTSIVAVIVDGWIHYATLGDGGLTLIHPDGMVQELLAPHHQLGAPSNLITGFIGVERRGEVRIGSVRVEPGSLLIAMSDGASDLLPIEDIAHNRKMLLRTLAAPKSEVAERLLIDLEQARDEDTGAYLHSDNMTLAIAGIVEAEDSSNA